MHEKIYMDKENLMPKKRNDLKFQVPSPKMSQVQKLPITSVGFQVLGSKLQIPFPKFERFQVPSAKFMLI
jgi:hypothetical protein